ncbi:hypothetical protein VC83_03394 [Pseudogymnoascus destructans]|uniref:Uncharacterized protein n=2 Tax=Pseudogymnoascus destructans TaxID=655981 RepID=L8FSH5_PSED2|nr:uncharacterized protein VC83_03394 [Pseudogymnoascus destructans]ELR03519.1 hypothetical protein GMDG_01270 [Pseudogymnoascus destructans 20631-21]OAF60661.1 hypothetical protein VC83_03394 [Pseudogymnoascus destructans]
MTSSLGLATRRAQPQLTRVTRLEEQLRRSISTIELDRQKGDRERVVILGSGWAGFNLSRKLDKKKYQPVVISPRPYFAFTPLLASTAVGTLEFRTAIESVRARVTDTEYYQGWADDVSFADKRITVEVNAMMTQSTAPIQTADEASAPGTKKGKRFDLDYDKLVVAVGCYSQTFGTPGVRENAFFLKDVGDARKIRKRILDCFEEASLPSTPEKVKRQLLNFGVVGGGPTGVEFSAELFDLCNDDLRKLYPSLIQHARISIYDVAPSILSMFDKRLADYATNHFRRDGIAIKTSHHIRDLRPGLPGAEEEDGSSGFTLTTEEDGEVGVGMCVWSTGLMMNPFIQKALNDVHSYPSASITPPPSSSSSSSSPSPAPETLNWHLARDPKSGGLLVDSHFRVQLNGSSPSSPTSTNTPTPTTPPKPATMLNVFALGDVAVPQSGPLPATAQVANQSALWLARRLNAGDIGRGGGFTYRNLGVMTYLGNWKAIMQTGANSEVTGFAAWLVWRGAYLTRTISWRNKLLIPIYWLINWAFGRDIGRF